MKKYIGDAIFRGSLSVRSPKPLDDRLVVQNQDELYTLNRDYLYLGMPVSCINDGSLWVLVDLDNYDKSSGWVKTVTSSQALSDYYTKEEIYDKEQIDSLINRLEQIISENINNQIKHIILTQEEYDSLENKDNDTIYLIIEENIQTEWGLGDRLPIILSSNDWGLGDKLPIILSENQWKLGDKFPIILS